MAKVKKSRKSGSGKKGAHGPDGLGRTISESAQQIWLAGMGAFNRAQAEGSKLFEGLVRDGVTLERTARKFAGARAEEVRDVVEDRVVQARERAADTWDKLEKAFEDRVQRALANVGAPGREELDALAARVDRLDAELRKRSASAPKAAATPRRPAATRTTATTPKPAVKAVRKRVVKSTTA